MHVWTAPLVNHRAPGNQVRPAEYTRYAGLAIRRLAGVLAGRLEPTPPVLPSLVGTGHSELKSGCRGGLSDPYRKEVVSDKIAS